MKNQVAELRKAEVKSEQLLSVIIELMDVYEEDLEIADKAFNSSEISASAWAERTTVLNNLIKVLGELRKVYNQNTNTENKYFELPQLILDKYGFSGAISIFFFSMLGPWWLTYIFLHRMDLSKIWFIAAVGELIMHFFR